MQRIRTEARSLGLSWAIVRAVYEQIKAAEWEKRQRPNEVREAAWLMATASTPGSWPFWRHGFLARYGRKLARGQDYTCIPGYDEISQQIACEFPEYATDDGTQRLFDLLLSPYDRLPAADRMYRKALTEAERQQETLTTDITEYTEYTEITEEF